MSDASVYKPIYGAIQDEKVRDELIGKQGYASPLTLDFEAQLPRVLEQLDLEETKDNEEVYAKSKE